LDRTREEDFRHELVNGILFVYVYLTKIQKYKDNPDDIRLLVDTAIFKCKELLHFVEENVCVEIVDK